MGYASKLGKATISATNPTAAAVCDRCSAVYNLNHLRWQNDYRGRNLANIRILVCDRCEDIPQPQLKPRIIPPDPVSIKNARPERYCEYESNTRTTQGNSVDFWTGLPIAGGDTRITQDDNVRSTQITGEPPGGLDNTPGTSFLVPGNDLLGPDQGLPCGFDQIPQTGPLPPYSISVNWVPASGNPVNWVNNLGGVVGWESTIPSTSNVMD